MRRQRWGCQRGYCIAFISLLASALTAHAAQGSATPVAQVATVNGKAISLDYFNKKYVENSRLFSFNTPSKESVLDDMVKRELGIQEAKKLGYDSDPEIQDRMNSVLYQALVERQLAKQIESIQVSDDEAQAYYSKFPEIRVSHIFLSLRPNATPAEEKATYERMRTVQDVHLKNPAMGFAEAAQRFSEGSAAPMGGDLDYQTKDRLDPKFYETAVALRTPGKISGIIRTQQGLHIVKLTAVRPWAAADKGKIKRLVFEERRQSVFDRYMADLRKKAKVTIYSDILAK